jgi:hypothetical protein
MWGTLLAAWALAYGQPPPVFVPTPTNDEAFSETYTTIADLEDGTYIHLQLAITNLGPGDQHGICNIRVVDKGTKPWNAAKKFDREEWKDLPGPPSSLTIGSCKAVAGDKLDVTSAIDNGSVHVTLFARPAPVSPPDPHLTLSSGFYESEILVPWAKAIVDLKLPDQPSRTLNGHGYADHSRSAALPNKLARMWFRFRGLDDARSALAMVRYPPGTDPPTGYTWTQSKPGPERIRRAKIAHTTGKLPQWRGLIETSDGKTWRITSKELLHRAAPVEEYGIIGAVLGSVIGNPVTYTFRAVLETSSAGDALSGILETEVHE